jgi:hypothetical protein
MIEELPEVFSRTLHKNIRLKRQTRIAIQNNRQFADHGEINSAARETGQQLFELGRRPVRFV